MNSMRYTGEVVLCPRCNRETATALLPLSSGHIGRVCAECRTQRKGRPFSTRFEYERATTNQPMPTGAEGFHAPAPR